MAVKMEELISHVRGWVNSQIEITVAISYSHMIHGAHILSPMQDRSTTWEVGLGLELAEQIAFQNSFTHTCTKIFCLLTNLACYHKYSTTFRIMGS